MAALARHLGVGMATLYSHVRGQDELRQLACDAIFDSWELPSASRDTHWAHWLFEFAHDARRTVERYPVVHGVWPLAGGQLRYLERVLAQLKALGMSDDDAFYTFHQVALLILGVGAEIEATRLEQARTGLALRGIIEDALASHPGELPILSGLERDGFPDLDDAFDELVWFTLTGIARRRGEVLPAQPPGRQP